MAAGKLRTSQTQLLRTQKHRNFVVDKTVATPGNSAYYLATMQEIDDEDRKAILGEVLFDELKIIREYLEYLVPVKPKVDDMDERLKSVEADMKLVKMTLRQHSKQLNQQQASIDRLEKTSTCMYRIIDG